jgi:hypothetical protein
MEKSGDWYRNGPLAEKEKPVGEQRLIDKQEKFVDFVNGSEKDKSRRKAPSNQIRINEGEKQTYLRHRYTTRK